METNLPRKEFDPGAEYFKQVSVHFQANGEDQNRARTTTA
jgi:hypothetical protein